VKRHLRWSILLPSVLALVAASIPASAEHATRPHSRNMVAKGHSPHPQTFPGPISSDLAFWGNLAFQGNYDGFRVIDITDPDNPQLLSHAGCNGDQGDIVVWDDILVRSWNSPAPAGRTCDGDPVPQGFEGLHIWDISNVEDPDLIGEVELSAREEADAFGCGSHTAAAVPDPENNRLIIYNLTSGGPCPFIGIVAVPLDDPASAAFVRNEPLTGAGACHDAGVILGDVNKMVCASGAQANVYDIGENDLPGGSLVDPGFLYTISEPGVGVGGNWHSAAFTWDGEVIILGWEPGGGTQAECEATDPDVKKSMFFYDADTGSKLGQWVLPRPQGRDENCTIHNYDIVPLRSGRYVAVSGNYQAGTWVTDFTRIFRPQTDPANRPVTVAWSDPPSLGPGPFCDPDGTGPAPGTCQLGGAWSSYWYNNFIYESEITKGLNVFRVADRRLSGAIRVPHLNPQTQEFSL
jgi:hypothetical protein